jgi:hypothetical protein
MGCYYNQALVGIEDNDQGGTALRVLKVGAVDYSQTQTGYPNIYYRQVLDRKTNMETQRIGWHTGGTSKDLMLGQLQEAVDSHRLLIHAKETLGEMEGFAFDPEKDDWVQTHRNPITKIAHTDEVMSLAIAYQMLKVSKTGAKRPKVWR